MKGIKLTDEPLPSLSSIIYQSMKRKLNKIKHKKAQKQKRKKEKKEKNDNNKDKVNMTITAQIKSQNLETPHNQINNNSSDNQLKMPLLPSK